MDRRVRAAVAVAIALLPAQLSALVVSDPIPEAVTGGVLLVARDLALAVEAPGIDDPVVVAVADYSPAAEQGIQVGDVIASVALTPVANAREIATQVAALRKDGNPVVMFMVKRQGSESFFALRLAEA